MFFAAKVPIVPIIIALVVVAIVVYFVFFHKDGSVVVSVDSLPGAIKTFYAVPGAAGLVIPRGGDTNFIELSKDGRGVYLDIFAWDDGIDYEDAIVGLLGEWEYTEIQFTEEDGIAHASIELDESPEDTAELCTEILDELFRLRGRDQVTVRPQGFTLAA